ncbi:hypothetical protein [Rhodococcus sp. Leaf278]|uniref:hypothetical protein n=1 Tax=Rhodococcus sp. Leaf278 TaxID=1736319 RepID=UPI000A93E0D1|nr:hypothetical protein [Rhodococcus sp. Leaf278]
MWFDPDMGMADNIRKKQDAERAVVQRRRKQGLELFDNLVRVFDQLAPEVAQALIELGVKPTEKAGFMKRGWMFDYKVDILVRPDGSWDLWSSHLHQSRSRTDLREHWEGHYSTHDIDTNVSLQAVRGVFERQVENHANAASRR